MVLIHNLENEVYLSGEGSIASKFLGSKDDKEGEWNHAVYMTTVLVLVFRWSKFSLIWNCSQNCFGENLDSLILQSWATSWAKVAQLQSGPTSKYWSILQYFKKVDGNYPGHIAYTYKLSGPENFGGISEELHLLTSEPSQSSAKTQTRKHVAKGACTT